MDADRFDTFARRLVAPTTRRTALGAAFAGGVLSAIGLGRAASETEAAQRGVCVLAFAATVRQGPSLSQALTTNGAQPGEVRGELSFALSGSGALADAVLRLSDGTSVPVVGQATGHSLQLRIELASRWALVAIGVGERAVADCRGAIDGVASGPDVGDLGDWHAAALSREDEAGATEVTPTTAREGGAGRNATASSGAVRTNAGRNRAAGPPPPAPAASTGLTGSTRSPAATQAGAIVDLPAPSGPSGVTAGVSAPARGATAPVSPVTPTGASGPAGPAPENAESVTGPSGPAGTTGPSTETTQCAPGLTACDGVCVDVRSDARNCGACRALCMPDHACCGGTCCETFRCCGGVCCAGSQSCDTTQGTCVACPAGTIYCGAFCTDLATDPYNCGTCGTTCGPMELCTGGACTPVCDPGLTYCNGFCVDTASNVSHCGGCDLPCATGQVCQGGKCGTADTPLPTDPGALELTCAAQNLTDCGGFCADLQFDPNHCGVCGKACGEDFICVSGQCVYPSICEVQGLDYCGGACVDLLSDAGNCGVCGHACGDLTCFNGECVGIAAAPALAAPQAQDAQLTCEAQGLTDCAGVCVDLLSDANHCGACGAPCGGLVCRNGVCSEIVSEAPVAALPDTALATCADKGLADCGGVCVDLLTDHNNCGACGHACYPGLCRGDGTCTICTEDIVASGFCADNP
jgi:hypothetical protein